MPHARAWVRLPSGRRLDLLDPTPFDWADEDLALGLARTYRWGGHSAGTLPLSVAQHSLLVLALRRARSPTGLSDAAARRELLHDADEGLLGFDPISPLKPFLGAGYAALAARLQTAIAQRYALEKWGVEERRAHKQADRIAAASEAIHVVGWTRDEVRHVLRIAERPVETDPLASWFDTPAWQPWDAVLAADRFLRVLHSLLRNHSGEDDRAR
ncbi:MAG TPA: phosphohydrolase [Acetobacteraceae bacterium]|nr:phosphohydrolase [Acetobacteraceae bacterium]